MEIFGDLDIGNIWRCVYWIFGDLDIGDMEIFGDLEILILEIFGDSDIGNIWRFGYWRYLEIWILEIFGDLDIGDSWRLLDICGECIESIACIESIECNERNLECRKYTASLCKNHILQTRMPEIYMFLM